MKKIFLMKNCPYSISTTYPGAGGNIADVGDDSLVTPGGGGISGDLADAGAALISR